jgi:hypothetical protein
MLQGLFGAVGRPPERVTSPAVFALTHGVGLAGRKPSAVTIRARVHIRFCAPTQATTRIMQEVSKASRRGGSRCPLLPCGSIRANSTECRVYYCPGYGGTALLTGLLRVVGDPIA